MRSANATIALYLLAPLVAVAGLWTLATAGTPFKAPQKDWANGELAAAYEDQFDRAFPLRTAARNIWAALRYRLFAEGAPGLVVGEHSRCHTGFHPHAANPTHHFKHGFEGGTVADFPPGPAHAKPIGARFLRDAGPLEHGFHLHLRFEG